MWTKIGLRLAIIVCANFGLGNVAAFGQATCKTTLDCAQAAATSAAQAQGAVAALMTKLNDLQASLVGAVMAFNATTCPKGWVEYTPAQGRFIRGIDKPSGGTDPDGQRSPGSVQNDAFASHSHDVQNMALGSYPHGDDGDGNHLGGFQTRSTDTKGGAETRPKNVALLYCIMK